MSRFWGCPIQSHRLKVIQERSTAFAQTVPGDIQEREQGIQDGQETIAQHFYLKGRALTEAVRTWELSPGPSFGKGTRQLAKAQSANRHADPVSTRPFTRQHRLTIQLVDKLLQNAGYNHQDLLPSLTGTAGASGCMLHTHGPRSATSPGQWLCLHAFDEMFLSSDPHLLLKTSCVQETKR